MAIRPPNGVPVQAGMQHVRPPMTTMRSSYVPTTMLPGFFVNSDQDIRATDVPMDGSISFFPYQDLSRIVIKQWSGGPTFESATYVLERVDSGQTQQQSQQPPLPPPPPPVQQSQAQDQQPQQSNPDSTAMLANVFNQFGGTLQAIQDNLERLNSRFVDEGGCG